MNIELTLKQHSYLIAFLPNRGDKEVLKYIIQVANKLIAENSDEQLITVSVPDELILNIYSIMGQQQERLTTVMNDDLKGKLLEQVSGNSNVMQGLGAIAASNANDLSNIIASGYNFLLEIKA